MENRLFKKLTSRFTKDPSVKTMVMTKNATTTQSLPILYVFSNLNGKNITGYLSSTITSRFISENSLSFLVALQLFTESTLRVNKPRKMEHFAAIKSDKRVKKFR